MNNSYTILIQANDFWFCSQLKLAHHDGTPVQDDNNPVIVKHGYTWETEKYTATKHKLPSNGLLELDFYVNDPNATTLGIEVRNF